MQVADVIIIGAGAAGLMCAIEAARRGRHVIVLEKANKIGKKILISGGGRCNFTNLYTNPDNFISNNPHFCKSALSRYTQWDFIHFLESSGLHWHEKKLGQLFCDEKSAAVVNALTSEAERLGVKIQLETHIESIEDNKPSGYSLLSNNGEITTDSLVIATGGPSIPKMGASDFAHEVAKQFGISSLGYSPALVPFIFRQEVLDELIRDLSGVSVFVEITLNISQKPLKSGGVSFQASIHTPIFKENILFTHRGISGPAALQISSYWQPGDTLLINLLPELDVLDWLSQNQQSHANAELKTVLAHKLPKRLAHALCAKVLDANISNKTMRQLNSQDMERLASQLTQWQLTPSGTEGMRTAEVSLGGIDTNELSSKTFECKKQQGLYFIGEAVDVTGHLGGFNFQWAWSSGWCAGQYV